MNEEDFRRRAGEIRLTDKKRAKYSLVEATARKHYQVQYGLPRDIGHEIRIQNLLYDSSSRYVLTPSGIQSKAKIEEAERIRQEKEDEIREQYERERQQELDEQEQELGEWYADESSDQQPAASLSQQPSENWDDEDDSHPVTTSVQIHYTPQAEEWDNLGDWITAQNDQAQPSMSQLLNPLDDDQFLKDRVDVLSVIGKGGVSTVYAVEMKRSKRLMAMKVTSRKHQLIGKSYNETRMMQTQKDPPFMSNFIGEYESQNNLYLFETFAAQGDLHHMMMKRFRTRDPPFSEEEVIGVLSRSP